MTHDDILSAYFLTARIAQERAERLQEIREQAERLQEIREQAERLQEIREQAERLQEIREQEREANYSEREADDLQEHGTYYGMLR